MCTIEIGKWSAAHCFQIECYFGEVSGVESNHKCIECGSHTIRWRALNYSVGISFDELISLAIIVFDSHAMYLLCSNEKYIQITFV